MLKVYFLYCFFLQEKIDIRENYIKIKMVHILIREKNAENIAITLVY